MTRNEMRKDKYYVYEHWIDGVCFYVGKGRKRRPFELKSKRNKLWNEIVCGRYDEIKINVIKEFDTNKEAIQYETELTMEYVKQNMCKANGKKYGASYFNKDNPFYGEKHTEETKKKISESLKGRYIGENNPFYGKKHTKEALEKMSRAKPVYCVELNKKFESIKAVAEYFGTKNTAHVTSRIRAQKPYKGYTLIFIMPEDNFCK